MTQNGPGKSDPSGSMPSPSTQSDSFESLGAHLESLATSPAPRFALDIDRAIAEGRAGRRRRATRILGSSAACLAVVSLMAAFAVFHVARTTSTGMAGAPEPASTSSADDGLAPPMGLYKPDPLVLGTRFGWLPDAFSTRQESVQMDHNTLWLDADAGEGTTSQSFRMTTFVGPQTANGASEYLETNWGYQSDQQIEVGSQPAYWLSLSAPSTAPTNLALIWQQEPSARWTILTASAAGMSTAALKQQMLLVAQRVTPDYAPIALPVRLNDVPAVDLLNAFDLQPATMSETTGTTWSLQFTLDFLNSMIVYHVGPAGKVEPLDQGQSQCKSAGGLEACVTVLSVARGQSQSASELLHSAIAGLTLMSADPSTWTTDVFIQRTCVNCTSASTPATSGS